MSLRRWLIGMAVFAAVGCGGDDGGSDTTVQTQTATTQTTSDATSASVTSASDETQGATSSTSTTTASTTDATSGGSESGSETTVGSDLDPPAGGSSGGMGGGPAAGEMRTTGTGIVYRLIAPGGTGPHPLMIVYSGTEGGQTMTQNLLMVAAPTGTGDFIFAILDGVQYNGNGQAGADVLDDVRAQYDIDNDRTYLLSESAGTTAGLELGLDLRQSYFAAYWANDVNASATPVMDSTGLGFQPFGNAGPGGDFANANAIVMGMMNADYRTPPPAPYDGPGSGTHGSPEQFVAALQWFPGKTRL